MAEFLDDVNRKLVPRWRSSELTVSLGELAGPLGTPAKASGVDDFDEKLSAFRAVPTVSSAAELIAAGFVHSRTEETLDAAEFIRMHARPESVFLRDLALRVAKPFEVQDPDDEQQPGDQIRWQRRALSVEPRNPLKWVDLARNYLLIGRPRKAKRAIEAALQLAPDDRFVLRAATRLYLHLHEAEKAYFILNRSEVVQHDPALIGPQIAVSALTNRTSGLMRRGLRLLEGKDHSEAQLSELAAILATEELERGSGRRGRQLFRRSLTSPNENVVAQVRWAATKTNTVPFDPSYLTIDRSFEARAWTEFLNGDWGKALTQSKAWLSDQGFSRRPACLGSFVAAVAMEDHVEAISILRRGLMSNPSDSLLLNNLAYSLACIGQIIEAEQMVQRIAIKPDDPESASMSIFRTATSGLIEYRKGNHSVGREFYRRAFESAVQSKQDKLWQRVALFFSLEEVRAGRAISDADIQAAINAAEKISDPVLILLAERLRTIRAKQKEP